MNIIASTSKQPYVEFVAEMLNEFEKCNIRGIAVVALCDDCNLTGYWNMGLRGKEEAKAEINHDCIDEFIMNNADRYEQLFDKSREEELEE